MKQTYSDDKSLKFASRLLHIALALAVLSLIGSVAGLVLSLMAEPTRYERIGPHDTNYRLTTPDGIITAAWGQNVPGDMLGTWTDAQGRTLEVWREASPTASPTP